MSVRSLVVCSIVIGVAIFFLTGNSRAEEPTGVFYQWTTESGDVASTDDPKRIPAKYRDVATERSFAKVGEEARVTEVTISAEEYAAALERSLERSRRLAAATTTSPSAPECDGPITVTQERRNYEERGNSYNSLFYIVRDSCGNVTSETRNNPVPLINTTR